MDEIEHESDESEGEDEEAFTNVESSDSLFDLIEGGRRLDQETWNSLGSDIEIKNARIRNNRPLIKQVYSKARSNFGKVTQHTTADAVGNYIYVTSVKDPKFNVRKVEREIGVQNVTELKHASAQTLRFRHVNKSTQVQKLSERTGPEQKLNEEQLENLAEFLEDACPMVNKVIQQCRNLPIFEDDFSALGPEDAFIGRKSASQLRERQSYTHLEYSKNKTIASIDMHPTNKGMIAFSCLNADSFEKYVRQYGKSQTSYVIVWNTVDPIYAHCVLTAPLDISVIKFHPTDPDIVVGGAVNGQVLVWNLGKEDLSLQYSLKQDLGRDHVKTLRWTQISFVESSHTSSVNDIQWLPPGYELGRMGELVRVSEEDLVGGIGHQQQFFTVSSDGKMLAWDLRKNHLKRGLIEAKQKNEKIRDAWIPYHQLTMTHHSDLSEVTGVSFRFDHQDPYRVYCTSQEGDLVICKWQRVQIRVSPSEANLAGMAKGGQDGTGHSEVEDVQEQLGLGRNTESSRFDKSKNIVEGSVRSRDGGHFGVSRSIDMHPTMKGIFLTVGDWSFKIWKIRDENEKRLKVPSKRSKHSSHLSSSTEQEELRALPIWSSPYRPSHISCGFWSPSRPSVVFLGREDGWLEVWDFMDKSFEPSMTFSVTQARITSMTFRKVVGKRHTYEYLAVGSSVGTLHIIDIPQNFIRMGTINENTQFTEFIDREISRVNYYKARWKMHKRKFDNEQMKKDRRDMDSDEEFEFEERKRLKRRKKGGGASEEEHEGESDDDDDGEAGGESDDDDIVGGGSGGGDDEDVVVEEIDYVEVVRKFKEDLRKFTENPELILDDEEV